MGTHNRIAAESSRLHRLFTLGAGRVSLTDETLHVDGLLGGGPRKIPVVGPSTRSRFGRRGSGIG